MPPKIEPLTRRMIRNASDEAAVKLGTRFDAERASHVVWWIERYCRLYEGTTGPLILMSIADQPDWEFYNWPVFNWGDEDFRKLCLGRLEWHLDLMDAGEHMDWQYDCHARIYGWTMFSEHHDRDVRRFKQANVWIGKKNKKSPRSC